MAELDRAAIALRLAQAREEAGLTQEELAELLDLHWRTIQNYESPKVDRIPFGLLGQWAEATGVTREWLLFGEELVAQEEVRALFEELGAKVDGLIERLPAMLRAAIADATADATARQTARDRAAPAERPAAAQEARRPGSKTR
jgi:transcriptional regulator with XRE-family HTH domain